MKPERTTSKFGANSKFKPIYHLAESKASSQLLNHIKDEQFYSSLTTIALQLAK